MAITLVSSTAKQRGGGYTSVTSDAINTTGATLLILVSAAYSSSSFTPSDSKGNEWHSLTTYGHDYDSGKMQIHYAYGSSLSVGTSHTFTSTNSGTSYNSIGVLAFSGFGTEDPFDDDQNGYYLFLTTTIQPGSITPPSGALVVSARGDGTSLSSGVTVNEDFAEVNDVFNGSDYSYADAWKTGDGTAENPTWTTSSNTNAVSVIAAFIPSDTGLSLGPHQSPTIGMNW